MLATRYKQVLNQWIEPGAKLLARTGIHPNVLTLSVPVLVAGICFWFVQTRRVLPFCVAVLAAGSLDGLDGAIARVSGKTSKLGAYLDAMADRYVEAMIVIAVAMVTGYWLLSAMLLAGALLVSYAKARAAMEVSVGNLEWPDFAERAERGLIFLGGLAASALCTYAPMGRDLFWWTLVVLNGMVHATVVQRMLRARRYIEERS